MMGWEGDELWYRREWAEKDYLLSPRERTKRAVHSSLQGLTQCLTFTVETGEDFTDGWLPILGPEPASSQSRMKVYTGQEWILPFKKCHFYPSKGNQIGLRTIPLQ